MDIGHFYDFGRGLNPSYLLMPAPTLSDPKISMQIERHRLQGEAIRHLTSPNQGGPYAVGALDTIIIHYTACRDAQEAIDILCSTERRVSAHLVVGRDGSLTQLLPFDTVGWHAGQSRWGTREHFNQYSLGIEIDNAGQLEEKDGRFFSWWGAEYPSDQVVEGVHRHHTQPTFWHAFPARQIDLVERLCALLTATYPIDHILGHEEIAPQRKIDPGPAFPLDRLRGGLFKSRPVLEGQS